MKVWRLKKGEDRRLRQGHPWAFVSELSHSAREIQPGELIELRDAQNHFLAYGYGHPTSQICFRRLSSRAAEPDVLGERFFAERLAAARKHRVFSGWARVSHRWLYAEADGVPGLIVDAFLTVRHGWVVVVQSSTAGIDRALPALCRALESWREELGSLTVIEAPTSKSRTQEGLTISDKRVISTGSTGPIPAGLESCTIHLQHGLELSCNLLGGQKTGFFLDQQWNASLLRRFIGARFERDERTASPLVRVLDICSYVGQWSAHAAHALQGYGVDCEVTLVDVSESALTIAAGNLAAFASRVNCRQGDALTKLADWPEKDFDIVICDPPAFVKKKADLAAGLTAYAKINREAMRKVKVGGLYVACSCSGLVRSEDWRMVLMQSAQKAGRMFRQLAQGGHGPDHPVRPEFPEGEYLKCTLGQIDYPY